jgi:hypothetical protein
MSFAFECFHPPQALILGLLSFRKQLIDPLIVFDRSC